MPQWTRRILLILGVAATLMGPVRAADIVVLAPGAFRAALEEIVPAFQSSSGHAVKLTYAPSAVVSQRIEAGAAFDLAITSPAELERFTKGGVVEPGSVVVGGNSVTIAWRRGSPAPDLSSDTGLRAALLAARAVSFSDPSAGGSSSNYFVSVLDRLGIANEVRAKAITTKPAEGAFPLAEGRADLAVAQTSEVAMATGLDSAPLFPNDPRSSSRYAAGISRKAAEPVAARALLDFLQSPASRAITRSRGLAPG
ncbi:MAG: molybdate ABC transporter substrate-binding protein [Pseudomonadota bacterium]